MQFISADQQPFYFLLSKPDDTYWNGAAWVSLLAGAWSELAIDMPNITDNVYSVPIPAAVESEYGLTIAVFGQQGDVPLATDPLVDDKTRAGFDSTGGVNASLSLDSVAQIVAGLYNSLAGIQPTVSLTYDPRTMKLRLVDGDDWRDGIRTIDIPIELPESVEIEDCTATFGAVKGAIRIDRTAELMEVEDVPNIRLTFFREDTLGKPAGSYNWDVEVQHTSDDVEPVISSITVLEGSLELRRGIAKIPADIE